MAGREQWYFAHLPQVLETGTAPDDSWRGDVDHRFHNWEVGASRNIPVMAAVTWLIVTPGIEAVSWWQDYLKHELGGYPGHRDWGFGSGELLSRMKWQWNVHCVHKVLDLALEHSWLELVQLAREWLTRAHALHALAALRWSFEPWRKGPSVHNCGPRSDTTHWGSQPLDDLFAGAIGAPTSIEKEWSTEAQRMNPAGKRDRPWQYLLVASCEHFEEHLDRRAKDLCRGLIGPFPRCYIGPLLEECFDEHFHTAGEYHFLRWSGRVITLYGNHRNAHGRPLLARMAEKKGPPDNVAPRLRMRLHYPRVELSIRSTEACWTIGDEVVRYAWNGDVSPKYHVIVGSRGIRFASP